LLASGDKRDLKSERLFKVPVLPCYFQIIFKAGSVQVSAVLASWASAASVDTVSAGFLESENLFFYCARLESPYQRPTAQPPGVETTFPLAPRAAPANPALTSPALPFSCCYFRWLAVEKPAR
jgi:hypothetical protein